jgi:hypothetical protein
LAKCGKFLPKNNGIQHVNHTWAYLSLKDGEIKIDQIIDLGEYLSKKKDSK